MPIYEYGCGGCGHQFEMPVPMSASDVLPPCPECQGTETRKLPSVFSGRSASGSGTTSSIAGSGGCGGCSATSCGGCSHG
ncbi:MAG: zinc ribbon domain-containing protein [Candidatus Riflebacteria bacterium]|nr:zinc ribbon domain-containing protein [Candidatus Riflebacteria bacterium]